MLGSLHKTRSKTVLNKALTNREQRDNKGLTKSEQNGRFLSPKSDLRRSLRDGVFLFPASGYPQCHFCHIAAGDHKATVRSVF
jgi:hypothetical protein